ncbi:uncharacterized protein LOC134684697 [Mytilus trossulus]|uniref:uncharacterized protein LOC134684697 n=1 Tax=Mytilus trossulus TaxID=6551 RepID=UPI0030061ADF
MTTMLQSLFVFHVGIVFLCIVTDTRGQQSVFATNETYEWLNAKQRCTLLKDEKSIASSNFSTTLGWTNFSAKYLPWVEYKGCFKIWRTVNNFQEKQVTEGEQLQECMVHCNTSKLFGLQNSTCICIFTSNLTELFELSCDKNVATCSGDPFAFCGTEGRRGYFSMYQIVNIDREPRYKHGHIGNCLEMDTHWNFKANKCLTQSIPLCYDGK